MNKALPLTSLMLCGFMASVSAQRDPFELPQSRHAAGFQESFSAVDPQGSEAVAFIEASLLMNVRADGYVAVFGLTQESPTVPGANETITARIREFTAALERLGIKTNDILVDFISQSRVYTVTGPEGGAGEKPDPFGGKGNATGKMSKANQKGNATLPDDYARETLSGFEVKKNVTVRFQKRELLDEMRAAAAKSSIFDLVKVDYIVGDVLPLRARLLAEAAKVIRRKEADYATLFGVRMRPLSVDIEKYDAHLPSEMYSPYSAEASRELPRGKVHVVAQRSTETFCYNPLNPADFDAFIGEAGLEPVVHPEPPDEILGEQVSARGLQHFCYRWPHLAERI